MFVPAVIVAIFGIGVWWAFNYGPLAGPHEKVVIADFMDNEFATFKNVKVASKGKCPTISADAQALGVSEAWLLVMDYDREVEGNTRLVVAWAKQHGQWRPLFDDKCP